MKKIRKDRRTEEKKSTPTEFYSSLKQRRPVEFNSLCKNSQYEPYFKNSVLPVKTHGHVVERYQYTFVEFSYVFCVIPSLVA